MKKAVLCLAFILLFASCSSAEDIKEQVSRWRSELTETNFVAEITLSAAERVEQFVVSYTEDEQIAEMEIISPENLKGITASMSGEETELKFDDLVLGINTPSGLSPVKALPMLTDIIKNGYIEQCYKEKNGEEDIFAVIFSPYNDVVLHLWLSDQKVPLCAELEQNGTTAIKITITEWE